MHLECCMLLRCDPLQCTLPEASLYQSTEPRMITYEKTSPRFMKQECMASAGECDRCDASDFLDHATIAADRPCQVCSLARACGCCPGTHRPPLSSGKPCDLESSSLEDKMCSSNIGLSECLRLVGASFALLHGAHAGVVQWKAHAPGVRRCMTCNYARHVATQRSMLAWQCWP